MIKRESFPEIPPRVVYSLTPIGEKLLQKLRPIVNTMFDWGIDYVEAYGQFTQKEKCESKLSENQ